MYGRVAKVCLKKRKAFSPQALSNTAWAFAKASHHAPELFDAIADEAADGGASGAKLRTAAPRATHEVPEARGGVPTTPLGGCASLFLDL